MMPLTVTDVHKRYDARNVLEAIDFALTPGEIFGLIGLNGAGKTTLIKIILDLTRADRGCVTLYGEPALHFRARRHLTYLPEKFQPSRYLRGFEYLDLSLAYYGLSLDTQDARAKAAGLDLDPHALGQKVGAYSKGMGQKLGLLGAFMTRTPLLILDEPMSGLDPSARIKLKEMLLTARGQGRTIFFSSHILSDIDEICDRIGVIHDGRLFFIGAPGDFKSRFGDASLEKSFLRSIERSSERA